VPLDAIRNWDRGAGRMVRAEIAALGDDWRGVVRPASSVAEGQYVLGLVELKDIVKNNIRALRGLRPMGIRPS